MTETQAPPSDTSKALGDDSKAADTTSIPARGRRFRLFPDGDYRVMQVADGGVKEIPKGSFIPIAGAPPFTDSVKAKRWIKTDSGDTLSGMQVVVVKLLELANVRAVNRPVVEVECKPKSLIGETSGA